MKIFMLKAKKFIKRNIYPITVTLCTALMIAIISISAFTSINNANLDDVINTNKPVIEGGNNNGDNEDNKNDGNLEQDNENQKPTEEGKPTGSNDPIIFNLPFENATVSKEYAEDKLLYDKTTNFWCTHQGLDFSCKEGQLVYAVYDGTIEKIENSMMNGTVIYLKVSDNLTIVYKGLASELRVKEGDKVKKGQELGKITSMLAEKADGVHLHLELMKDKKLVDPTDYFSFNK